ncbi:MAG: DDE-type integrase/transposase/recombinase [Armatimonadetes bacterium]|nr:DDE-type integrase/transposase/recombinase [Armatimonadota bacterium]
MGKPRLRNDDLAKEVIDLRERLIREAISKAKRSPERAAVVARMVNDAGLSEQACYKLIRAYEAALQASSDPRATLTRRVRKDAGAPRSGGGEHRRAAAWFASAGASDSAAEARAQAERAARELQASFVHFAIQPGNCELHTPDLAALYLEQHPGAKLPHQATLNRWLREAAPELTMTEREQLRARQPRGRVEAKYPNHLWLADQHVADTFCWFTKPDGEIVPRRPTLFHFLDRFTGLPTGGGYSWTYSSETVALALWDAMRPDYARNLPWSGVPEWLYWDRGSQHWSEWLVRTCAAFGIKTQPGTPYEWAPHGFIEGMHRIIHDKFEMLTPGYSGSDAKEEELPLSWRLFKAGEGPRPEFDTLEQHNAKWHTWRRWLADRPYRDGQHTRQELWDRHVRPAGEDGRLNGTCAYPSWEAFPLAVMARERRKVTEEGTVVINHLVYQGAPLHELMGEWVELAVLPGHMGRVWVLDGRREKLLGVAPLRDPDLWGEDPSKAAAGRRIAESRRSVREIGQVKAGMDSLAARGRISPEEAAAAGGVLSSLQAVAKAEVTTVAEIAAAAPTPALPVNGEGADNVVAFPRPKAEERALVAPPDHGLLAEVLSGASMGGQDAESPPQTEPAPKRRRGLYDF